MRLKLPAVILLAGLVGIAWYFLHRPNGPSPAAPEIAASANAPTEPPAAQSPQPPARAVAPAPRAEGPGDTVAVAALPAALSPASAAVQAMPAPEPSALPPATLLENMRTAVRNYGQRFGGNPVGTNPEITKALNGGNPKQVNFINPEAGLQINSNGELVDSWGTPFFFHQLSATEMEIRSAGPDRKMWTSDDLVIK